MDAIGSKRMYIGQWLTNTATALEEHPHTIASFLVDTARSPNFRY